MSKKDTDSQVESKSEKPAKKNKDKNKDKKPNIFVRLGRKLKETFGELKRVSWPTFGQAVKATGVGLVIVLIFMVLVTGVNYGLSELLKLITKFGTGA